MLTRAAVWLGETIGDGEWHREHEVVALAERFGFSRKEMKEAAQLLAVEMIRIKIPALGKVTAWRLAGRPEAVLISMAEVDPR